MTFTKSNNQTVLITGSANRIGKGIALKLAGLGYNIALHHNNSREAALKTAAEIKRKGGHCEIFAADLGDEQETKALIPAVTAKMPRLTLLINSASIFEPSRLISLDLDNWNRHFSINLKTPYILTSLFANICKKGHIINILDTNITKNKTSYFAYLLSKKSLHELTKLSAVALAPQIRVNAIAPGLILPPAGQKTNYLDRLAKQVPLKRKGEISNITHSVKFLIENDYLTGQVLFNDGGEHLL